MGVYMEELKKPLLFNEQVLKLEEHGMIINDESDTIRILSQINYYRYTGYALQFRICPSDSNYINDIRFEKVYRIYQFDKDLRDILRKYIEYVEVFFRTQIAYGFSVVKCINPPHNQHYDVSNFYNKQGYQEVMESFKRERNYYKDSLIVNHHKLKYNSKMPLWVIVELMSFSNLSKLYNSMYISEQETIANTLGISAKTMSNHLHCLSVLRNKCAHAARLYNTDFNPPAKLPKSFLQKHPEVKNNSLFAYLIVLIKRLPEKEYRASLILELEKLLEEYKDDIDLRYMVFPQNYKTIWENILDRL